MKIYVCLTGRVLMYWGVVGLEPALGFRVFRVVFIDCLNIYDAGHCAKSISVPKVDLT